MKTFIAAIFFIGAVAAHGHGHKGKNHSNIESTPGCENATSVKDIKANTCCPGLPKLFDNETRTEMKQCKESCKSSDKKDFCCKTNCLLTSLKVVDASGNFSASLAITLLTNAVNNSASWPIATIVNNCVTEAPTKVQDWEAQAAAENKTMKCSNPSNFVIVQCIRRNLILSCPTWVTSTDCTTLMTFAQNCPRYPFGHGCGGKHGDKTAEKQQKKEDKKEKKEEKKAEKQKKKE